MIGKIIFGFNLIKIVSGLSNLYDIHEYKLSLK
jgi:hypothetical protein